MPDAEHEELVEHDPLAEEADLLTVREAQARVGERLRDARAALRALEEARGAESDVVRRQRGVVERLEAASDRYAAWAAKQR